MAGNKAAQDCVWDGCKGDRRVDELVEITTGMDGARADNQIAVGPDVDAAVTHEGRGPLDAVGKPIRQCEVKMPTAAAGETGQCGDVRDAQIGLELIPALVAAVLRVDVDDEQASVTACLHANVVAAAREPFPDLVLICGCVPLPAGERWYLIASDSRKDFEATPRKIHGG